MSSLEGLIYGLSVALTPENLLAALIGGLIGTFVGVLPGIGAVGAMAILLSTTSALRPETALIMLAGIYYGAMYGGSTTSILVNVPGEAASIMTAVDGYQMARKGRAGAALSVSAVGSFIAGTIGVVGLMFFAPALAQSALAFGPPEYFMLALLGLMALSRVSGGSVWRGLLALGLGLAFATVGTDIVSGRARFTFGNIALSQGIEIVPVAVGLYGLAEVLIVAEQAGVVGSVMSVKLRELFPSLAEWRRAMPPILRGTFLGFAIGLLPGPSGVISTFMSYRLERRLSKHPEEFGKGAIEGVAGPESANNAATSGHMVPLLALGLGFGPSVALLLAALTMQGVQPGPLLMQQRPEVFWGVVASMYVGNVMLLILNLPLVGMWVSLLKLPQSILLAFITMFMLIGAYSVNNSMFDLVVLIVMGILGYVFKKLRFELAPLVLALVLGPFLERSLSQSLIISHGDPTVFATRPISGVMTLLLILMILWPLIARMRSGGRSSSGRIDGLETAS
jgi:putative tricarboxylic transport membrane protein